jgi:hypothetical protein
MFIDRWEKARLKDQVATLEMQVADLMERVLQLEGWIPVGKGELEKNSPAYKWVREYEISTPKKRGRPVGSKNKEKV